MLLLVIADHSDSEDDIFEQINNGTETFALKTSNPEDAEELLEETYFIRRSQPNSNGLKRLRLPIRKFGQQIDRSMFKFYGEIDADDFPGIFLVDAEAADTPWSLGDMINMLNTTFVTAKVQNWAVSEKGVLLFPEAKRQDMYPTIEMRPWTPASPGLHGFLLYEFDPDAGEDWVQQYIYRYRIEEDRFQKAAIEMLRQIAAHLERK